MAIEVDLRDHADRDRRIDEALDEAEPGEGFVLVNDHDPKPLYHQFDAEAGPEFHWEYRRRDPGGFRVLIGKAASSGGASAASGEPNAPF